MNRALFIECLRQTAGLSNLILRKAWRCKQNVNTDAELCFLSIVACSKC